MARGKKTGGRDFKPGENGGHHRPKGAKDRLTKLAELVGTDRKSLIDWFKLISQDPRYRENLLGRIADGRASAMEHLLVEQIHGKPIETHKITGELSAVLSMVFLGERKDPLRLEPKGEGILPD